MAGDPDMIRSWRAAIGRMDDLPIAQSSADLVRLSMQAVWDQDQPARVLQSKGTLHLGGVATADHSARLFSLGSLLVAFQQLVTAAGAAIEGIRTSRGTFPADLIARTSLRQRVPLLGGSVTVHFGPEVSPAAELVDPKRGVALIDQPERQFVDRAVEDALALLRSAHELGPDVDESELVQALIDGGPRLASALRRFARAVSTAEFRVETTWAEPHQGSISATFTPNDAAYVDVLIKGRQLDEESVVLAGTLYTSSIGSKWQLDLGEGAIVPLDLSHMTQAPDFAHLPPTQRVRVDAKTQSRESLDGTQARTYRVETIEPIVDDAESDEGSRSGDLDGESGVNSQDAG